MLEKLIMFKVDYTQRGARIYDTVTIWYRSIWGFKKKETIEFGCYGDKNMMGDECKELIRQLKERREVIEREYNERTKNTEVPETERE